MAWWTFRKKTAPRLGPAPVDPRRGWAIHPADAAAFMRALPRLLPPDAVLILENSGHPDVVAALAAYRLTEHPTVSKGTVFPPGRQMYLSVSASQAIAELLEHHPARRVCWHFHAATHERVLVEWHDAFADRCALSEHGTCREMRWSRSAGSSGAPCSDGSNDGLADPRSRGHRQPPAERAAQATKDS